jgi:broad specificity phosphatase PhoE
MGRLILVRHGRTPLNRPGDDERLRGWLDVPLDEEGLKEAATIGERLAGHPIEITYSSDLRRARQTAETIRRAVKSQVVMTPDLRPWNLGVFCGQRVRDLLPFLNQLNQHPELPAPSGESYHQFFGRYSTRLRQLMNLAEPLSKDVVVITHVRNLLATKTIVEHGDRDRVPVRGGPPTGTLMVVEKRNGAWRVHDDLVAGRAAGVAAGRSGLCEAWT